MSAWEKRYLHDCQACEWRFQIGTFDMYFCPRSDGGTILARYGDKGNENASYPLFVLAFPMPSNAQGDDAWNACAKIAHELYQSGRIEMKLTIRPES